MSWNQQAAGPFHKAARPFNTGQQHVCTPLGAEPGGLHMVGANLPKVKLLKTLLSKQNKATAQRERHKTNRSFGSFGSG